MSTFTQACLILIGMLTVTMGMAVIFKEVKKIGHIIIGLMISILGLALMMEMAVL